MNLSPLETLKGMSFLQRSLSPGRADVDLGYMCGRRGFIVLKVVPPSWTCPAGDEGAGQAVIKPDPED